MNEAIGKNKGNQQQTKVLYVNHEKSNTELVKLELERTGRYEVRCVNVPEHALEVMREFGPDVVLIEDIMPRMPGGNVMAAMRQDRDLKNIPAIYTLNTIGLRLDPPIPIKDLRKPICGIPVVTMPCPIEDIIDAIQGQLRKP